MTPIAMGDASNTQPNVESRKDGAKPNKGSKRPAPTRRLTGCRALSIESESNPRRRRGGRHPSFSILCVIPCDILCGRLGRHGGKRHSGRLPPTPTRQQGSTVHAPHSAECPALSLSLSWQLQPINTRLRCGPLCIRLDQFQVFARGAIQLPEGEIRWGESERGFHGRRSMVPISSKTRARRTTAPRTHEIASRGPSRAV